MAVRIELWRTTYTRRWQVAVRRQDGLRLYVLGYGLSVSREQDDAGEGLEGPGRAWLRSVWWALRGQGWTEGFEDGFTEGWQDHAVKAQELEHLRRRGVPLEEMSLGELRVEASVRGLATDGTQEELITRIREADTQAPMVRRQRRERGPFL